MRIPFTKAHGAKNDFLLTWSNEAPRENLAAAAEAICDRRCGVGADGWLLVSGSDDTVHGSIRLFNPDGGEVEMSGNGTRCAAAFLIDTGLAESDVSIRTGAGIKTLRLIERSGLRFSFEMDMGLPEASPDQLRFPLALCSGPREVSIVHVGNPQCVVFVDDFDFDWRSLGVEIERHAQFPRRTNVSFVKVVDAHALEVRFWERGAGETWSSGTGSTGAVAAAVMRGAAQSPVRVMTPAGPLDLRWDDSIRLTGPAEIVAGGEFYF